MSSKKTKPSSSSSSSSRLNCRKIIKREEIDQLSLPRLPIKEELPSPSRSPLQSTQSNGSATSSSPKQDQDLQQTHRIPTLNSISSLKDQSTLFPDKKREQQNLLLNTITKLGDLSSALANFTHHFKVLDDHLRFIQECIEEKVLELNSTIVETPVRTQEAHKDEGGEEQTPAIVPGNQNRILTAYATCG